MKYVVDTNVLLAVALGEPEKEWLVEATDGCELVAPEVLPYEIANAISALLKRLSAMAVKCAVTHLSNRAEVVGFSFS